MTLQLCILVLEKTKKSSKGKILTDAFYKAYSKLHFQLTRNYTSTGCFTFIEDCSSNGTFVNGCKLGKGSKQFLSNNDEVAICEVKNRLFVYMETVDEKENIQVVVEAVGLLGLEWCDVQTLNRSPPFCRLPRYV